MHMGYGTNSAEHVLFVFIQKAFSMLVLEKRVCYLLTTLKVEVAPLSSLLSKSQQAGRYLHLEVEEQPSQGI